MEQFGTKYFRGQGPVFLGDRDANGNAINLVFIGDLSTAELSPNVDRSETIETVTGVGAVGASFIKRVSYTINLVMRSIKRDHLALALQGSGTAKVVSTVTDEAHTCQLGGFSALAHVKINTVVVTGAGGTPTYVADTDYKVHADEGMIEWLSGGTITDALPVLIDYGYAAQDHVKASPSNVDKYLVFAGKNSADSDKQTRCEVYKIALDPSVLSMITDETAEMPIAGTVKLDTLRADGDQFYSWKIES